MARAQISPLLDFVGGGGKGYQTARHLQVRRSQPDSKGRVCRETCNPRARDGADAGTALAQKVSYDYDKTATFAGKTYALRTVKVGQQLIDAASSPRSTGACGRGLTKTESNPDLFVVYRGVRQAEGHLDILGLRRRLRPYGWGYGGGWGGTTTSTQVRDILVGTLVIDLADAKKGQVIWRGMGVKEVDTQAKPEKRDKSISSAVNKIFKNYPPKAKS
jgi:hypothetical protein